MIDNLLAVKELPVFILELFNNNLEKIARNTTVLDSSLAEGLVYKILIEDKYEELGYETAILYLTKGSSVKEHVHINDSMKYMLIYGDLKENGKSVIECECKNGRAHSIETVSGDTVIYTYRKNEKIKKLYISADERRNVF